MFGEEGVGGGRWWWWKVLVVVVLVESVGGKCCWWKVLVGPMAEDINLSRYAWSLASAKARLATGRASSTNICMVLLAERQVHSRDAVPAKLHLSTKHVWGGFGHVTFLGWGAARGGCTRSAHRSSKIEHPRQNLRNWTFYLELIKQNIWYRTSQFVNCRLNDEHCKSLI